MTHKQVELKQSIDIVAARQASREMVRELDLGKADQTRLATAVSELARNVIQYAGEGVCVVTDESDNKTDVIRVVVEDHGPGIADVDKALESGFTGILLQRLAGSLNDEQAKQLNMVRDSSRHLLNLINDILDISKIEAGQMHIVFEPFDMREAIKKVVQGVTPLAEEKMLSLSAEIAQEVCRIVSDRRRVEQILINLVNNAVKFTEKGDVRVECEVGDGRLVTRVVDTGIGIKPEDMGKLFNVFQQIDTGLARLHEGSGLRLSIVKKLVEMLGGEVRCESEWGAGSVFTFTLPMTKGVDNEAENSNHRV
ncbi:hypothetical protein J7K50_02885 [bacterium]|nr:hypothetical protein [bacterium]